ncbi:hypothetical protein ACT8ZV_17855 [Nocardioides sp. MAHUQ-72]|uniref:hypothetical protein n=1 Tax=unclassified Nocardioides TaxID=2615069 RepID=UPI003621EF4C
MTALRPSEADLTVGLGTGVVGTRPLAVDLARILGTEAVADYRELPPGRRHYCLVPPVPAVAHLSSVSDGHLTTELGATLRDTLYALQHTASQIEAAIGPTRPDPDGQVAQDSGSISIVLPAAPALGQAGASLAGAFCGGSLSLARTLAIELKRQRIRVNTLVVDEEMPGVVASIATQLTALMSMPGVTGQEIYLADGLDSGRIRP